MAITWERNSVDAIIFDFGGVLIDVDYQRVVDAFAGIGWMNFDHHYTKARQSGLFDKLEVGAIKPPAFREALREISLMPWDDAVINKAWNSIIIGMPAVRVKLLRKIKEHIPVFLLSNTNQIHEYHFTALLIEQYGINPLPEMFNGVYLSHRIGVRKPDAAAFELVIKENGLDAARTLFIDDSRQHIDGAQAVGLKTHWLGKEEKVEKIFSFFLESRTL